MSLVVQNILPSIVATSVGQVLSATVNLAAITILARLMTQDEFGSYQYYFALFGIATIIGLPGSLHSFTVIGLSGNRNEGTRLLAFCIRNMLYIMSGGAVVLFFASLADLQPFNYEMIFIVVLAASISPFLNFDGYLVGTKQFLLSRKIVLATSILSAVAMCSAGYFIGSGFSIIVSYILCRIFNG